MSTNLLARRTHQSCPKLLVTVLTEGATPEPSPVARSVSPVVKPSRKSDKIIQRYKTSKTPVHRRMVESKPFANADKKPSPVSVVSNITCEKK